MTLSVVEEMSMPTIGYATVMSNPSLLLRAARRCKRLAHCQPFGFNAELAGQGSRFGMISWLEGGTISCPALVSGTIPTNKGGDRRLPMGSVGVGHLAPPILSRPGQCERRRGTTKLDLCRLYRVRKTASANLFLVTHDPQQALAADMALAAFA